eukprot:tig00000889_g5338.t1
MGCGASKTAAAPAKPQEQAAAAVLTQPASSSAKQLEPTPVEVGTAAAGGSGLQDDPRLLLASPSPDADRMLSASPMPVVDLGAGLRTPSPRAEQQESSAPVPEPSAGPAAFAGGAPGAPVLPPLQAREPSSNRSSPQGGDTARLVRPAPRGPTQCGGDAGAQLLAPVIEKGGAPRPCSALPPPARRTTRRRRRRRRRAARVAAARGLKLPPLAPRAEAAPASPASSPPDAAGAPPSPLAPAPSAAGPAPGPAIDDRTIRVFLSSTFKDMEGERNEIFRSAFPRVQRLCAARGLHLVFVDLRWGISEEESRQGQVILACLRELQRSTYFVSFLKRRYGWHAAPGTPDPSSSCPSRTPERSFLSYKDRSVTEVEVISAALDESAPTYKPEGMTQFFFASGELFGAEAEESAHAEAAMARLKETIRAARPAALQAPYASAAQLANAIHDGLLAAIERDFPRRAARSWLEEERVAQEAHAHALRTVYVRRAAAHEALDAYAAGSGPELFLLSAPSGYGKSAVMASWVQEFAASRARDPTLALVTHFVGGSEGSASVRGLVRRVHDEVREALAPWSPPRMKDLEAISDETDLMTPRGVRGLLGPLLALRQMMPAAAVARWRPRLVLVLDAPDRLDSARTAARRLAYLPTAASAQLRILVSAGPGEGADAMRAREHLEFELGAMAGREKQELARKDLRTVGKGLDAAQMARVAASEQCGVPLYLKAVLQELKASAVFETLTGLLEDCLRCGTPEELCGLTLRRWLGQYPEAAPALRTALCCLAASRFGLAENELQALAGAAAGGPHAAPPERDGRASPSRPASPRPPLRVGDGGAGRPMAEAVEAFFGLRDEAARRPHHERLARFFGGQPAGDRRALELPFHLLRAGRAAHLPKALTDLDLLHRYRNKHELAGYWRATGLKDGQIADLYKEAIADWEYERSAAAASSAAKAGHAGVGGSVPALTISLKAEKLQDRLATQSRLASLCQDVGVLLRALGAFAQATGFFRRSLETLEEMARLVPLLNASTKSRARSSRSTKSSKAKRGAPAASPFAIAISPPQRDEPEEEKDEEEGALALEGEAESAGELAAQLEERLSGAMHNLAALEQDLGHYKEALPLYEKCLRMDAALAGYPNWNWRSEAAALAGPGATDGESSAAETSLATTAGAAAGVRLGADALATMINLGDLYRNVQSFEEAVTLLERALLLATREFGENHPGVAAACAALAAVYSDTGDHAEALDLHARVLRIYELAYGSSHPQIAAALNNQALAYEKLGDAGRAQELLTRALAIREAANGPDHVSVAVLLNNLGELLRKQGKKGEAVGMFERSLRIREGAYGPQHHAVSTALNNLAALLEEQGDLQAALPMLQRSLAIRRAAYGDRHATVATALNNVAEVMTKLGQLEAATAFYEEALDIAEEVYGGGAPEGGDSKTPRTARAKSHRAKSHRSRARSVVAAVEGEAGASPPRAAPEEEPVNPIVGNIAANFARNLEARGQAERAVPIYERALEILARAHGEESPAVGLVCASLGLLHDARDEPALAIPYYRRSLRALEAAHGPEAAEVAVTLHSLAALYLTVEEADMGPEHAGRGQGEVATEMLRRCLAIRERHLGPHHADTKETASWLANVLQGTGAEEEAAALRATYGVDEADAPSA